MDQKQQQQAPSQPLAPTEQPGSGLALDMALFWIETHRNKILGGVAAAGLAGLIFVIYTSNAEAKQYDAAAALYSLTADAEAKPSAEAYRKVASETKGTGIEQHARLREGAALFGAGDFAGAASAYDAFVRDFPASLLLAEATLGVAVSFEAQGKDTEALSRYQELTTRFPQSALVNRAKLSIARLQEKAGDTQLAFRTYQELAAQMGSGQFGQRSGWQIEAMVAARRLVAENPSLIQTNAPAAMLPSPAPFSLDPPPAQAGQ